MEFLRRHKKLLWHLNTEANMEWMSKKKDILKSDISILREIRFWGICEDMDILIIKLN